MAELLFISDVHLSAERPACSALFLRFLQERAPQAEALYILGDLFDAWIGDDDDSELAGFVRSALRELSDTGTRVCLMHGNRDFLLGEDFSRASGADLIADPTLIEAHGQRLLLMHGDTLCTDDIAYQQTREMVRSAPFIARFMSHSLPERAALAAQYRKQSGEATSLLAADIMDVNAKAVQQALNEHGADLLVHGHTHREGEHRVTLNGREATRIVLAEWHNDRGMALVLDDDGWRSELIR